jgi:glycerophosphoryl diester phosphodiesterase
MTYLGYANPLYRIGRTIQGWLAPPPPGQSMPQDFYLIAHRGAARVAPENTITAFAKAVELGANAIETDICVTQDNRFLLWHDADPDTTVALARQMGGEGLLYVPNVPALGSPWRQPVSKLALSAFRTCWGYVRRQPGLAAGEDGEGSPETIPAVLEELLAWLQHEQRLRHVFLDLKFAPVQTQAARTLLERLHRFYTRESFQPTPVFHLLSPHAEVVAALMAAAQRLALPSMLKLYADFELPGVRRIARRLGIRHVSMGCGLRAWADFRYEVAQVIAARDKGHFDTVVVWTVNTEARLRELVALGVNGIITDAPALLHHIVQEYRRRTPPTVSQPKPRSD